MTRLMTLLALLLCGACSTIERGVVVGKGSRQNAAVYPPVDYFWVDVSGKNRTGERVTERVQLYKEDWDRYGVGDAISPHDYDMIGATRALRASARKFARMGPVATPKPEATPAPKKSTKKKSRALKAKQAATSTPPKDPDAQPRQKKPKPEPARAASFRDVEAAAVEDPGVRDLKKKIYGAKTDDEQAAAYREYRRALYQKMRELEPSLKERIDQAESAQGAR